MLNEDNQRAPRADGKPSYGHERHREHKIEPGQVICEESGDTETQNGLDCMSLLLVRQKTFWTEKFSLTSCMATSSDRGQGQEGTRGCQCSSILTCCYMLQHPAPPSSHYRWEKEQVPRRGLVFLQAKGQYTQDRISFSPNAWQLQEQNDKVRKKSKSPNLYKTLLCV